MLGLFSKNHFLNKILSHKILELIMVYSKEWVYSQSFMVGNTTHAHRSYIVVKAIKAHTVVTI